MPCQAVQAVLVETIPHRFWLRRAGRQIARYCDSYFIKLTKTATGVFLRKSCFQKFCIIHRKAAVLESLLHKLQTFKPASLLKREKETSTQVFTCCEVFMNTYFEEQLLTAASELKLWSNCWELLFWIVAFKTILAQIHFVINIAKIPDALKSEL